MTELDELKQRLEIEDLKSRLESAEKRIALLTETLETLKDIQTSDRLRAYLTNQARLLRTTAFLNSVSDREKFDTDAQKASAQRALDELQPLDQKISAAMEKSRSDSMLAANSNIAEALGKWQSAQPDSGYEEAMKNLGYRIEDGSVTITGLRIHRDFNGEVIVPETLRIPDMIDGRCVARIGEGAFRGAKLNRLILPKQLCVIGKNAFSACTLGSLDFPDSLASIGAGAFASCRFTEIHLENTRVQVIPEKCFGWCTALEKVVLPETLMSIENNAFVECVSLRSLIVPANTRMVVSPFSDFQLSFSRAVAVLGMNTELVDLCGIMVAPGGNITVYCLPDSSAQRCCLENKIPCRHLSEFPGE